MPNPAIARGSTVTITAPGIYTRGTGGWDGGQGNSQSADSLVSLAWAVDDSGYFSRAFPAYENGYNVTRSGTAITLTVPYSVSAPVGTNYAVYSRIDATETYYYAVFDIVEPTYREITAGETGMGRDVSLTPPSDPYGAAVLADSPHFWFRMDEPPSVSASSGIKDFMRPGSTLVADGTPDSRDNIVVSRMGQATSLITGTGQSVNTFGDVA